MWTTSRFGTKTAHPTLEKAKAAAGIWVRGIEPSNRMWVADERHPYQVPNWILVARVNETAVWQVACLLEYQGEIQT